MKLEEAVAGVLNELDNAQTKYGERFESDHEAYGVLVDELQEFRDAFRHARPETGGEGIAIPAIRGALRDRELMQIAAVCLKALTGQQRQDVREPTMRTFANSAAYWRDRYETTLERTRQLMGERNALARRIDDALTRANGRWSEWGERAESVAEALEGAVEVFGG